MDSPEIKILVVDDEEPVRRLLKNELTRKGFIVDTAPDGVTALKALKKELFDVVLLDIVMPDVNGIEVMRKMEAGPKKPQIIVLTGQATVDTAVLAMKAGAYDYLSKPYKTDELVLLINRACSHANLERENKLLQQEMTRSRGQAEMVGRSKQFTEMLSLIKKSAPTDATVLIMGESGTGKELVANIIWRQSKRSKKPMIALNCASLSEHLLESELFGHEKGAFTSAFQMKNGLVEVADGGTLFLDEIGDMPQNLQAKLLRFLDSGEFRRVGGNRNLKVNVRLISATNKDLDRHISSGAFREDLFFRLNVVRLSLTPLRERPEDIPVLAEHFLSIYSKKMDKAVNKFSPEAMDLLSSYHWHGNVRELENIVERAVIISEGKTIVPSDLAFLKPPAQPESKGRRLEDMERLHITEVLKETGGNQKKASELLGIDRKTLYLKLRQYDAVNGK